MNNNPRNSIPLNIRKTTDDPIINTIYDQLNVKSKKPKQVLDALACVVANLSLALRMNKYIAYSRDRNFYRAPGSIYGMKFRFWTYRLLVEQVINKLIELEQLENRQGYFLYEKGYGFNSKMRIAENSPFADEDVSVRTMKYETPLILKDEYKNLIPYKMTPKIKKMICFLNGYNDMIAGYRVNIEMVKITGDTYLKHYPTQPISNRYKNLTGYRDSCQDTVDDSRTNHLPLCRTDSCNCYKYIDLVCSLYRVFNDSSWYKGGRYYGADYQQLNEEERSHILIGGAPVVERDYSGLHINMLYHLVGYDLAGTDPYLMMTDDPLLRKVYKLVALIAINASSRNSAIGALRKILNDDENMSRLKRYIERQKIKISHLFNKFESVHSRISQYLCSGIGVNLQYRDSEIATAILRHFTKQDIPCLCVHDSFIVPTTYDDELIQVMQEVYKQHMGYDIDVK